MNHNTTQKLLPTVLPAALTARWLQTHGTAGATQLHIQEQRERELAPPLPQLLPD